MQTRNVQLADIEFECQTYGAPDYSIVSLHLKNFRGMVGRTMTSSNASSREAAFISHYTKLRALSE